MIRDGNSTKAAGRLGAPLVHPLGHTDCLVSLAGKKPSKHTVPTTSRRFERQSSNPSVGGPMLRYAAIFFIIAIIAAVFGFGGIAAGAAEIAKVLFFIFLVIFLVTLLMGVIRR
jgi:uncharacterized membrane protein YtjA (UPF0391 family)